MRDAISTRYQSTPSRGRVSLAGAVILLASLLGGCVASKDVVITSTPPGARVQIFELKNGVTAPTPIVNDASPVRHNLPFPPGVSYKVVTSQPQFLTDDKTVIELGPKDKKDYPVALERYLKDVPYIAFVPKRVDGVWALVPERGVREGYIRPADYLNEKLGNIQGLICITKNDERPLVENRALIDISGCVMSPTKDWLVYQKITEQIIQEGEFVTSKDEKQAVNLAQIAASNSISSADLMRDNPGLPLSEPLKPETHVIVRHRELTSRIYKEVLGTPIVTPVSPNNVMASFPGFSFTGDSVMFAADNISSNALLWRMQLEGGGTKMVRITNSDSLDFQPSGGLKYVAYTSIPKRVKVPQVWLANPDGGEPSLITDGESPQISPDGDKILFLQKSSTGDEHSPRQLWYMNINGGDATRLTQNTDYDVIDAKWDLQGKWIVFASNEGRDARGVRNFDIWIMTADGRKKIQLTSDGSEDTSPSFDRTGNFIYFRSNRGGFWNVWRCELTPDVRKELGSP